VGINLSFSDGETLHLLLTLSILLVAVHAVGFLFVKLRQPRVAGEIVAGLLLGPTLLGFLRPDLTHELLAGNRRLQRSSARFTSWGSCF
jgi:hypothetical protein